MIFTNIPWPQVVLALCALITLMFLLGAAFWKLLTSGMRKDIHLILTNHIPHLEAKIDMILEHLKIPYPKE